MLYSSRMSDENIKQMIGSNGWEYKEKDGDGKRLIATTQMWTKDYVLVKIPSNFK